MFHVEHSAKTFHVEHSSWYSLFKQELEHRQRQGLYRSLRQIQHRQGAEIMVEGRPAANFSSNNYLGLADSAELKAAAVAAISAHGVGAGASRLISGNLEIHRQLEQELACWKGTESALLFNSGFQANVGLIPSLVTTGDLVLSDALNHASIIDGCRLSRATTLVYRHLDLVHLAELLAAHAPRHRRTLIVSESVFSMDGDQASVTDLVGIARRYDALLMLDEAHAAGCLGEMGRGLSRGPGVDLCLGTLGKAFGASGAYVCGTRALIDFLINRCRSFIYTTAPDLPACAAALAALRIISSDEGESRREQLKHNIRRFHDGLSALGLTVPFSHIIPVRVRSGTVMELSDLLLAAGIFAQGIRPPTVPPNTARLRFTVTASHTNAQIDRALASLQTLCEGLIY